MTKPTREPDLMAPEHACLPCLHGEHYACRGTADGTRFQRDCQDPCRCKAAKHRLFDGRCTDYRTRDWSLHICGKPAKGTWDIHPSFGGPGDRKRNGENTVTVERCGIHLNGLRKSAEHEAEWRAEWAARDQERDRERANNAAAEEWCDRLRREFGIVAQPRATAEQIRVTLSPERIYGLIKEAVVEMDAIGIEHGFHPAEPEPGE